MLAKPIATCPFPSYLLMPLVSSATPTFIIHNESRQRLLHNRGSRYQWQELTVIKPYRSIHNGCQTLQGTQFFKIMRNWQSLRKYANLGNWLQKKTISSAKEKPKEIKLKSLMLTQHLLVYKTTRVQSTGKLPASITGSMTLIKKVSWKIINQFFKIKLEYKFFGHHLKIKKRFRKTTKYTSRPLFSLSLPPSIPSTFQFYYFMKVLHIIHFEKLFVRMGKLESAHLIKYHYFFKLSDVSVSQISFAHWKINTF